jgi:hypothetical protein
MVVAYGMLKRRRWSMTDFDIVLRGGRVIDPESGLDAVRDVVVFEARLVTGARPGRPVRAFA